MESKVAPKLETGVLVPGRRTVAKEVAALKFQQELFRPPMEKYQPGKTLYFVLLERFEKIDSEFPFGVSTRKILDWKWAFTKKWARDQARRAEADGWKVVDISRGTICHPSHKFLGLKEPKEE